MDTKQTILEEAQLIIAGDRREDYGDVEESFKRIASLWSGVLDQPVTPMQVALCMIQLKVSREVNSHKRDNLTDICGYAALMEQMS